MDPSFWQNRWQTNQTAWHERAANPLLLRHFLALSLGHASRVFVPLCGKSLDLGWLLSQGLVVAGAELSELAVTQLFAELGMKPEVSTVGVLSRYRAEDLTIFQGNIFDLSGEALGTVDAIYDRAALVALPEAMRRRYAAHLREITANASQLLICYDYDQAAMDGPPFSVKREELDRLYGETYALTLLESTSVAGGLKGTCPAQENTWLLNARNPRYV